MRVVAIILLATSIFCSCRKFDDANPSSLSSFIRLYEGTVGYKGIMATETESKDGYIIVGNVQKNIQETDAIVIKTDILGNTVWQQTISNSVVSFVEPVSDGYLIVGDRIDFDPNASQISEISNTDAQLIKMDLDGNIVQQFIRKDSVITSTDTLRVDYHGSAVTIDQSGNLILLGSFKNPVGNSFERSFVVALDPTFQVVWSQSYLLQNRDYINSRSIYVTPSSNLIWASTAFVSSQNLSDAYLSVLYTGENSTFKNNDLFGENDTRSHLVSGISESGFNYGVVGTYAESNGQNANIYFLLVSSTGTIISGSERYFDGATIELTDRDVSESQDEGKAITGTNDGGFVIAGALTSTPSVGNGGKDVILIKVDAFGNHIWNQLIGGSGDEEANSISETSDGGLLICGTNNVNGLSSIFLIKTSKRGEIVN